MYRVTCQRSGNLTASQFRVAAFWLLQCTAAFGALAAGSASYAEDGELFPWVRKHIPADLPTAKEVPPPDPRVWQAGPYCGTNCAYVLVAAAGHDISHDEFAAKHQPQSDKGLSMLELQAILAEYGIATDVREVTPAEAKSLPAPFIARLKIVGTLEHFIVVTGYDSTLRRFHAIDGTAAAMFGVDEADFNREFSGYVLVGRRPFPFHWVDRLFKLILSVQGIATVALAINFMKSRQTVRRNESTRPSTAG
jgi:hypothetical protein